MRPEITFSPFPPEWSSGDWCGRWCGRCWFSSCCWFCWYHSNGLCFRWLWHGGCFVTGEWKQKTGQNPAVRQKTSGHTQVGYSASTHSQHCTWIDKKNKNKEYNRKKKLIDEKNEKWLVSLLFITWNHRNRHLTYAFNQFIRFNTNITYKELWAAQ